MSVTLSPVNEKAGGMDIANGTWFTLLNESKVGEILKEPRLTNDTIDADAEQCQRCADALREWTPPKDWFMRGREEESKQYFIEFFEECGGFTTY